MKRATLILLATVFLLGSAQICEASWQIGGRLNPQEYQTFEVRDDPLINRSPVGGGSGVRRTTGPGVMPEVYFPGDPGRPDTPKTPSTPSTPSTPKPPDPPKTPSDNPGSGGGGSASSSGALRPESSIPANLHGSITIKKSPRCILVRWHKLKNGEPCHMIAEITWSNLKYEAEVEKSEVRNAWVNGVKTPYLHRWMEKEERDASVRAITARHHVHRYLPEGHRDQIERVTGRCLSIGGGPSGSAKFKFEYDHPGDENSTLVVVLHTTEGDIKLQVKIPVNAYKGINVDEKLALEKPLPDFKASSTDTWTINF